MRYTDIGERPGGCGKKIVLRHIDKVGLFIYYDKGQKLDPDFIRRHLTLRKETKCLVETNTPEEAIKIFFAEWKGAKIGGACEECKALWINKSKPILELPQCNLIHKNKDGEFVCGEPTDGPNGEFGMCVLEGCDAPDDCPIASFWSELYERKKAGNLPIETIDGYNVVRAPQIMAT